MTRATPEQGGGGMSRRQWRDTHKPPIRRGDPVFELASWLLPIGTIAMFLASIGGRRRAARLTPDESAVAVVVFAVLIGLLLLAVSIRLVVKRGDAPLSVSGAVALVVICLLSMTIVLARNQGVLSGALLVMIVANGLCLLAGATALLLSFTRNTGESVEEG